MAKAIKGKKNTNSPVQAAKLKLLGLKSITAAHSKLIIFVGVGLLFATVLGVGLFMYFNNNSSTTPNNDQTYTVDEDVLFQEELSQQVKSGDISGAKASIDDKLQNAESNSEKVHLYISLAYVYLQDGNVDKAIATFNEASELEMSAEDEYLLDGAFTQLYYGEEDWVNAYKYAKKSLEYLQSLSSSEIGDGAYEITILKNELEWLEGKINE